LNRWSRGLSLLIACLLSGTTGYTQQKAAQPQSPLDNLFLLQETRTHCISSYDKTGGNYDFVVIPPGQTRTLAEIQGAGIIRRFYVAPYALDRMRYRKVVLRMYWDGQPHPCGWYGEGDDMIFIDGEAWPPTYPGTGTEEIFDAGCCPDEEFSGPYTGFYLIENLNGTWGGKNQMYRFYMNNPVRYQKSIRVTLEHGHANNFENDYTTTAFWYQKEPHLAFLSLPAAGARLPSWPEGVAEAIVKETEVATGVARLERAGKMHMNPADTVEWKRIETARNKDFRAQHYQDFIRDVAAAEKLFVRYRDGGMK
jgi:hypothetical protein